MIKLTNSSWPWYLVQVNSERETEKGERSNADLAFVFRLPNLLKPGGMPGFCPEKTPPHIQFGL